MIKNTISVFAYSNFVYIPEHLFIPDISSICKVRSKAANTVILVFTILSTHQPPPRSSASGGQDLGADRSIVVGRLALITGSAFGF